MPLLHWSVQDALARAEDAFYGLFQNLPGPFVGPVLRLIVFPWGRRFRRPADRLGHHVANLLLSPGPSRERLTAGMFLSTDESDPIATLEAALAAVIAAEPIEQKIRAAQKTGALQVRHQYDDVRLAAAKGIISQAEGDLLERARALRRKAIMVDDFPKDLGKTEIYQTTEPVTFEALAIESVDARRAREDARVAR